MFTPEDHVRAAILKAPDDMVLAEAPDPAPGDLVLRVEAATIRGTDIRILRGRKTAGVRPAIPCGRCARCLAGRGTLCPDQEAIGHGIDGAFAEFVPARAVAMGNVHRPPDAMSFDEAALVEPLACVLNGQTRGGLARGDTVAILGAEPIGLLAGFSKGEQARLDVNAIHDNELRVTGAFGLSRLDVATALRILADRRLDARPMITHRYGLGAVAGAFAQAERGAAVKVAVLDA